MGCRARIYWFAVLLAAFVMTGGKTALSQETKETRMYFSTREGYVYLVDSATSTVTQVAKVKYEVDDIAVCPGGFVYLLSEGNLYSLNIKKNKATKLGYTGDYYTRYLTCSADGILYGSRADSEYLFRISRDNAASFVVMRMKKYIYGGAIASLNKKSLYVINYDNSDDSFSLVNLKKKTNSQPKALEGDETGNFTGATFLGKTLYLAHSDAIYTLDRSAGVVTLWYTYPNRDQDDITGVAVLR